MSATSSNMSQRGFTLIEMMITIVILATLTILTSQSIQQAVRQKLNIQSNIDDYAVVRDAVRLIKSDINLAFHHRDLEQELNELVKKKSGNPSDEGGAPGGPRGRYRGGGRGQPQGRAPDKPGSDTHFVGLSDELHFVTKNHVRTVAGAQEADFGEVGYTLKSCTNRATKHQSNCLWRRFNHYVDEDVTEGGREIALLENIQEFRLRYFGEGKQDWVSEWRSTEGGDAVTKGNYPDAVELTMLIRGGPDGEGREIPVQAIIPIHYTNNKEQKDEENPSQIPR